MALQNRQATAGTKVPGEDNGISHALLTVALLCPGRFVFPGLSLANHFSWRP
jgi:hypothetical protein